MRGIGGNRRRLSAQGGELTGKAVDLNEIREHVLLTILAKSRFTYHCFLFLLTFRE